MYSWTIFLFAALIILVLYGMGQYFRKARMAAESGMPIKNGFLNGGGWIGLIIGLVPSAFIVYGTVAQKWGLNESPIFFAVPIMIIVPTFLCQGISFAWRYRWGKIIVVPVLIALLGMFMLFQLGF